MRKTIDIAEKNLNRVHDWIKGIDQKISIFLALQGIILTLLFPNILPTIVSIFKTNDISFWDSLFVLLSVIFLSLAVFESLNAIFPRTNNTTKSHLYFGGIKNMTLAEYKNYMKHLNDEDYFDELCEQVHKNSVIAVSKAERFQKAIILFFLGILFIFISYFSLKLF